MERLGRNNGRYHGETIDIDHLLRELHDAARSRHWQSETILEHPEVGLRVYHRPCPGAATNLYLSTGIHGDEPAGPLAMLQLVQEDHWPQANLWLVPCVNPTGFRRNTRENAQGIDLNRDYRDPQSLEVRAHVAWLHRQPCFDLTLVLHEDWESNGFYVYELNPEEKPSYAEAIIEAVGALCPIETAERVDNWDCRAGIIRPPTDPLTRPQWAEALWLIANKSPQSYTLETPSDYELKLRTKAHLAATHKVFSWIS
jgi:hypothetical protein